MHEPRVVEVQAARGVLPPGVEGEPVHGLTVTAALDPLQHHHHRHDHRRHAAPSYVGEQISEHLIGKQREALPVQHAVDRVRADTALAQAHRRTQQVTLLRRQTQRHREPPRKTTKSVATIVPKRSRQGCWRHAKNTAHLVAYPIRRQSKADRASANSEWAADVGTHLRTKAGVKARALARAEAAKAHGMDYKLARGNSMTRPYAVCTVTVPKTAPVSYTHLRAHETVLE